MKCITNIWVIYEIGLIIYHEKYQRLESDIFILARLAPKQLHLLADQLHYVNHIATVTRNPFRHPRRTSLDRCISHFGGSHRQHQCQTQSPTG